MHNKLVNIDYFVFIIYFFIVAGYGYWIYQRKKKKITDTHDFFLAEGSLTWWAIGASLIASNISAEQFIGMSGNGFFVGIAVAAYEWIAALALVIVAVWFMPVYLKNKIFTMPQFLKTRYNETVSLIMTVFWLFLYVFVNITSIMYLGALAINNLAGGQHLHLIMILLAVFAIFITLGGMKVIGYTDVIQVLVLIVGGLVTSYVALTMVSEKFGLGKDALAGFNELIKDAPDHFHMILSKPDPNTSQNDVNKYLILPGIAMYFAGQWIVNLNYWGCNQYITQRALGANLQTARTGILFAALLKLMMPVIVMLPGIAAYVLYKNGSLQAEMSLGGKFNQDNAYSSVLGFLPNGLKGLSLAALTAAVVASLAGKANSISTIFTLDIYKRYLHPGVDEKKIVWIGKFAIVVAMAVAVFLAPRMGIGAKGGFQYIQEYTGFVSPGIFAMFILGFFWKRTTSNAALFATIGGFACSCLLKFVPNFTDLSGLASSGFAKANDTGVYEIPFLDRMEIVFIFCVIGMVVISLLGKRPAAPGGESSSGTSLAVDASMFKVSNGFLAGTLIVCGALAALYA